MEPISWTNFFIIFLCCAATMLVCRVAPLFVLKGRRLSPSIETALKLIPPAAFAALVANDLFAPGMFSAGIWAGAVPLLAALVVIVVAWKTKSLLLCGVTGVAAYALLLLI